MEGGEDAEGAGDHRTREDKLGRSLVWGKGELVGHISVNSWRAAVICLPTPSAVIAVTYRSLPSDAEDMNVLTPVLLIMVIQGNLFQLKISLEKLQFNTASEPAAKMVLTPLEAAASTTVSERRRLCKATSRESES